MDFQAFSFIILWGSLLFLTLNWVYFYDWMRFIGFFLKIIAPNVTNKDIEKEKFIRNHPHFKAHQRKWKKKFLIVPFIFDVVFAVLTFLLNNLLAAFFLGAIAATFFYNALCKKEKREQTAIVKVIRTSDSSPSSSDE